MWNRSKYLISNSHFLFINLHETGRDLWLLYKLIGKMLLEQVSASSYVVAVFIPHTAFVTSMSQHGTKAPISILPDTLP